ncbi:MAG: type 1 glutamine amidotransferase [Acidiferrobacterales bacterium]
MRILVFQHIAVEHPGIFRDFLATDGIEWDVVELDKGEPIPALDAYDALWVMGGPMDVWEEDKYPWLVAEKTAIHEALTERALPYLGVCLGHQLLADALGGKVHAMEEPEIGILDVELTAQGIPDPLLAGLPKVAKGLQWHSAEVVEPPPGAVVLARSPACAVQALRVGENAYGLQYHLELTDATVPGWAEVPAYEQALEDTLGPGVLPRFEAEARRHMPAFNRDARQLYTNFMSLLRQASWPRNS